jgi:hypothetical protein
VILPALEPRVEETYKCAGLSVEGTNIGPFPRVASKAGIRQVAGIRLPAMFTADDVVYLMRRVRVVLVKVTILTPVAGAFCDESPQRLADVSSQAECVGAPAPWP